MNNEKATSLFDLCLSVNDSDIGYSSAVLVHEALKDYSRSLVRFIADAYERGDHESAMSFLHDYETIADVQYSLFVRVNELARTNEIAATPEINQPDRKHERALALSDFLREFKPKGYSEKGGEGDEQ